MPGMSGVQLVRHLVERAAFRPTVIITGYAEITLAVEAMKLGVVDFLEKPCPPARLVEAVKRALEQEQRDWKRRRDRLEAQAKLSALSAEERAVLNGIARGLTNREIAAELDVSLRTVQFRRASLVKTLGIRAKSDLLALVEKAEGRIL